MVLGDSCLFFEVVGGSCHFLVVLKVLGCSWLFFCLFLWFFGFFWCFLVFLGVFSWFLVILGGSLRVLVVFGGSDG